jgi:hypothetical protein
MPGLRTSRIFLPGWKAVALYGALLSLAGWDWASRAPQGRDVPSGAGAVPLANETALLSAPGGTFSLWRFQPAPRIVVAIFPSLHAQALALNRVAAFVEKAGAPRNHVLNDEALIAAIGAAPDGFDTYYYGHDYRAADLARFYAEAGQDGVALNDAEQRLKSRLESAGFFTGAAQALITVPPPGPGPLDGRARSAILDHELSHGAYFTESSYANYVATFWNGLSDRQRGAFRHFLGSQGYDTANDDLMRNETQAYLAFTGDPRMFDPSRLFLPEANALRASFINGVNLPWLRADATR